MGAGYDTAQISRCCNGSTSYLPAVRRGFEFPVRADEQVQRWRRMGASWQAIANNFGCSVHEVRKAWDPAYVPLHVPAEPIAPPRAEGSRMAGQVARSTYQFDILIALDACALSRVELGRRVDVRAQDFARLVTVLVDKRLVSEVRANVFDLTADGRAEIERHRSAGDGAVRKGSAQTQARRRERGLDILRLLSQGPRSASEIIVRAITGENATRALLNDLRAAGEADFEMTARGGPFIWSVTDKGRAALKAAGRG